MSQSLIGPLAAALADRYRIERELGRGGMGTVFLAEDLKHHRRVAIKVLEPGLSAALGRERFLREIEISASLNHPHVLPVFDSGAVGELLYYVMPYVEGESLQARLAREKQLPLEDALKIAREVADALAYAHGHGVVHRDIKPGNILLQGAHAVVADFGLARAMASAGVDPAAPTGAGTLTAPGSALGTPAYMSPEQAAGSRDVDGRSDLYSLGCVLYEMLTGQPPFTGPTVESLVHQHLSVAPRPVTDLRPAVPGAVRDALAKSLAKTPADRFATTAEFAGALAASAAMPAAESNAATADAAAPAARRRRRRWLVTSAAALVLVLLAVMAWQRWGPFARWPGGVSRAVPTNLAWILVAEFDGPPDDSLLTSSARSLVSAALDESGIVATVPRDQIRVALQRAGKPVDARVGPELARELAFRSAVRTVLEGDISRIGRGYSVVLRVVNADSSTVVLTERATARDEDALIPVLDGLARKLRRDLGERQEAIVATGPMMAAATPSFEAFRLYVRARQRLATNQPSAQRTGVLLTREALARDPGFFGAWALLGMLYYNLGERDSSHAAFVEAMRHSERATLSGRMGVQFRLARVTGDLEGSLATIESLLETNPYSYSLWNTRSVSLEALGRFEQALESIRRAKELAPVAPSDVVLGNEAFFLSELGRFEEARQVAETLPGLLGKEGRTTIEIASCEWAKAESLGAGAEGDTGVEDTMIPLCIASARAGRGAFRQAVDAYARAEQGAARSASPSMYRNKARRGQVLLAVMSRGTIPLIADTWSGDSSTVTLLTRGMRAAAAGDLDVARHMLAGVRVRPDRDRYEQGATPLLLEAWIRGLEGRWREVVSILAPAAEQPTEGDAINAVGLSAVRWTMADAYERSGEPDSAAFWLEKITSDPRPLYRDLHYRGTALSAAHQRLAVLYARMGRVADAERHLAVLERWWDRRDDVSRRMIEEARAAVRDARRLAG